MSANLKVIDPEFPNHVYRLKKALYGLKQAPRAWYDKLSSFLIEHGFTKVHQSPRGIFISQSQYAIELLKKHGLDECVSMSTPMATERLDADLQGTPTDQTTYRRMIGGLMYLTASRPDIAFATFICACYQACLMVKHLKEVKRIFRYLRQSYNMGLWYPKDSGFELIAYSDEDHAGCKDDCKSTSGGLQFLVGKLMIIWMRTQLLDYGYKYNRIPMYYDSKSAIAISCNPVQHSKTKHIDIQYHFIKEHVEKGTIEIYFVGTEYQLADLFSKALPKERFEYLVHRIAERHHQFQDNRSSAAHGKKLCKIFSKCLTTRVTGWDQPPLQIMQMMYCFVNNIHVDYAELLWEGLYYSLHHPTSLIPYPRFTKIIVSHYMTIFPDISRRARDKYHNLQDNDIMKNIFNSGRHKDKVGMQIPAWMITEEMKHTEHYRMYAEVFGIDVPLTQSQPTESTQGTHRTPSAPRSPNPNKEAAESSAPRRSTVIRLRIPKRRSTRLTPPAPVPNVDKADEMILQDTLQVSLAEHKSREEQEARENVALVDEHLESEEIEKMVDGQENVVDDSSFPRNDESNIPNTRIEPRSNKESPEVEITKDKEVEITKDKEVEITKETPVVDITNVVIPVNVNDEDEEITDEVYELKRREKGKIVEETRNSPIPTLIRSPRIHTNLNLQHIKEQVKQVPEQVRNQVPVYVAEGLILERQKAKEETERLIAKAILQERGNIQAQISTQIENAIANVIPSQVDASVRSYMSGHILYVHPAQSQTDNILFQKIKQYQLYLAMKVDPQLQQQDIAIWLALQMKFERNTVPQTACRTPVVRQRDQDDPHDDYKEVEITKETPVVDITNVVIPVNVNDEDEEITDEVYELKRREKGKIVEETRNSPIPTPIRSPRIHTNLVSLDTEKLQELTDTHTTSSSSSPHTKLSKMNRLLSLFKTKPTRFKHYKSFFQELQGRYGYLFAHLRARFMPRKSFDTLANNLHDVMVETLPTMVDKHIKEQVMKQVPKQVWNQVLVYVAEGLILERQKAKEETERLIAKAILQERGNIQAQILTQIENAIANVIPSQVDASDYPHDDAHPEGENSAKWQKTLEYEAYVSGEPSSGQVFQVEQAPSTSGNQEQDDDFDFWTDSYASDDDEIPTKQVSQDIMEEVSLTIDEAKLRKMADEMLRQRCTAGDEHQYHIDQMKNFLKSNIVWESRKEILVSLHPRKTTPLVHSCQQDPEALALSLINQDLLYLKKGNSRPEKIVLSLHKFPAVIFNDDDIKERTSRWKEPRKPKEEVYSNSMIIQVVKTYWELGHEHKFIIEIVARRANKYLVSITDPDYKNLNKNDIEDIYLLIMNGKVPNYADTGLLWSLSVFIRSTVIWERVHDFQLGIESYQQKVNLASPTMTFPGIKDHEMFSIIYKHVHGIIYKNSKKEKRVIRYSEIHKFCDATLNRVLEGLKSYNNDIKYGYVQKDLTKDEAEYLKLFEEEIEERLKHHIDTLILTTVADIQALLRDSEDELKDDSDEELLEAE
ncbi:retrovirus-related pol polyprotein from transposon TNT 1-94 [Tanacetum coccineum]